MLSGGTTSMSHDHFCFMWYFHKCHKAEVLWLWWIALSFSSCNLMFLCFSLTLLWIYLLACLTLMIFQFAWTRCKNIFHCLFDTWYCLYTTYILLDKESDVAGPAYLTGCFPFTITESPPQRIDHTSRWVWRASMLCCKPLCNKCTFPTVFAAWKHLMSSSLPGSEVYVSDYELTMSDWLT